MSTRPEWQSGRAADTRLMILIGAVHGVSHFFQLVLPALFPWLMPAFGFDFTEAGILMAVFFVASGLGQLPAGFLVDHAGPRRALLGGIACFVLSALVLAVADRHAWLLLSAALAGLGNSVFHPADFSILNHRVSGARLGRAFSVHGLAGSMGWAVAPVLLTAVATAADWRWAALASAALAGVAWVAVWRARELVVDHEQPALIRKSSSGGAFAFLGSRVIWLCFLFFALVNAAFAALQHFGTPLLHAFYDLNLPAAAAALTALLAGSAAGIFVGGILVGRSVSEERLINQALAATAVIASVLALGAAPAWSVTSLLVAMGFTIGLPGPARDLLVRRSALAQGGARVYGRVYGFVYAGVDVGVALSPLLFGPLMDGSRFAAVFAAVAVMQLLAMLVTIGIARSSVHGSHHAHAAA